MQRQTTGRPPQWTLPRCPTSTENGTYLRVPRQRAEAGVVPPERVQVEAIGAHAAGQKEQMEQDVGPSEGGRPAQLAEKAQRRVKVHEHLTKIHKNHWAFVNQSDGTHPAEKAGAQTKCEGERCGGVVQEACEL